VCIQNEKLKFIFYENNNIISSKCKEVYFIQNHQELYNNIIQYAKDKNISNYTWNEKLHMYYHSYTIDDILCYCGKQTKYRGFKRGYNNFCSNKCSSNSNNMQKRRMNTLKNNLNKKYGVDNVFQLDNIKNKIKDTNLKKYGVENPNKNEKIKNKIKQTNLKKYGVENYTQTKDYLKKTKKTNLKKHGVDHHMKSDKIKNITKQNIIKKWGGIGNSSKIIRNKVQQTNLEKYGVSNVFQLDNIKLKIKQTNLKKYGVENYTQTKDYLKKTKKTNLEKYGNINYFKSNTYLEIVNNNLKNKINNDQYIFIKYLSKHNYEIFHKKCNNEFNITMTNYFFRNNNNIEICTICNPINNPASHKENEVKLFLDELNIQYIENDRTILDGLELDIYLPEYKLGIEFNGLYWHSELYKEKDYHLNKTLECKKRNIKLLHIFEDDWDNKQHIIKSIILNKLNLIGEKIYARKCVVKEVNSKDTRSFLNNNHIQGFSKSSYKLGLYYNNDLVSLMTFGYRHTNSKKEFELIRFCNKINTNVIGAASKLFKFFFEELQNR